MIVLDASVVIKLLTQEQGSAEAVDRIEREQDRIAPDWLHAEIASALSKKVRYGGLPVEQANKALGAVASIMPDLVPATALLDAALEMSITLRHALYDCLYLALAIERRCVMLTSDRKFVTVVSESVYRDHIELLA